MGIMGLILAFKRLQCRSKLKLNFKHNNNQGRALLISMAICFRGKTARACWCNKLLNKNYHLLCQNKSNLNSWITYPLKITTTVQISRNPTVMSNNLNNLNSFSSSSSSSRCQAIKTLTQQMRWQCCSPSSSVNLQRLKLYSLNPLASGKKPLVTSTTYLYSSNHPTSPCLNNNKHLSRMTTISTMGTQRHRNLLL